MFEHFTFGAQAQSSFTPVEDTFPSPTDCSFTLEVDTSSCNDNPESESKEEMQDILAQLSSHSLRPSDDELPQPSLWNTLSPDFGDEMTDFTPEELTFTSSSRGKVTISNSLPNLPIYHPKHGAVANRRLQRQLNTQLQSCNTHMKDISSLVSNMISTSTQCVLHHPPSLTTSNPPFHSEPLELDIDDDLPPPLQDLHEDEGFAEMEDEDTEMTLRRASAPSGIRKWNVRFRANGECVGGPPEAAWMGRRKVRCVPRMRRRKPKVESVGE